MRTPIVAGNWKMNHGLEQAQAVARDIARGVDGIDGVDMVVAPPMVNLTAVGQALADSPVALAAQNMHWEASGAYTGEVSPAMLREAGCRYVIIGHSERRQYFSETDEGVNRKTRAALAQDLRPIVCIGESLEEREAGRTLDKVEFQVRAALVGIDADALSRLIIAYEPIWAIGTGKTATPDQAQEVHQAIRRLVAEMYDDEAAGKLPILYGGSVKPGNFAELLSQEDIDGGLVGGASLKADSFVQLVEIAARG